MLAKAAKQNKELTTAGEWLIDNFYIIQEQLVQLKEDLPSAYYKKLPHLKGGDFEGYPRIYELVHKLSALSDNVIHPDNTTTAVQSYQQVVPLKLGELWAIPIMIRLVLIDRLTEKSAQLLERRAVREKVEAALGDVLHLQSEEPGFLLRKMPDIVSEGSDDEHFLTTLARQIQAAGLLTNTERSWFDYKFRRWNTTLEDQLRNEAQRTSRLHLSIQNAISTLRLVSETDWSELVENCSFVERTLRLDPSGYYAKMDFQSRDRYRKVIEKVSAHSSHTEQKVAEQALLLAEEAVENKTEVFRHHVGYYLVDDGFDTLCCTLNYKMPLDERIQRWMSRYPAFYFTSIACYTLVLLAILMLASGAMSAPPGMIVLSLLIAFLPALDLGIVSVNRLLSLWLPPRILMKLRLRQDIPDQYRTLVVVPTLFNSPEDVRNQFETLEIRALANPSEQLQFVMLSDFIDADQQHKPTDKAILREAKLQVSLLNERYSSTYGTRFFLLHRERKWNKSQNKWMGWERKRGKLEELNLLLTNLKAETSFVTITEGFLKSIEKVPVKFIITLDADTKLPPGGAFDLIRMIAHPLNRAQIDKEFNVVKRGYGIIQPRISIPPKSAGKTWFSRIFSGNVGLDPYTTAVSDIYQDLFGEGIFTGKGIYDLSVFRSVLDARFPDNRVLSHDLLESTYIRCGMATDIELFDDFPSTYMNFAKRNHRWVRGDWQIMQWLFSRIPNADGRMEKNPINGVSKWKIFDNLRRSLTYSALLLMLLAGWTVMPGPPLIWTLAVLGISAFPIYSNFSTEIFARPARVKWKLYLQKIKDDIRINTVQAVTILMVMPHLAYWSLDAVVRTLYRMFKSNEYLLEWISAMQAEREAITNLTFYIKKMWFNPVWAIGCTVLAGLIHPVALIFILPFTLLWMAGPFVVYWLSVSSPRRKKKSLSAQEISELRGYARRTWHYFERYVNAENSWLPPDNFQEEPFIGTVSRTSPTNIGFGLASTYVAYEFGYLSTNELLNRLDKTISSMDKLERYHGHLFNWYNTQSGALLEPRYISTVDSGNLAATLLFVRQSLRLISHQKWPNQEWWNGLEDTTSVLNEIVNDFKQGDKKLQILGNKTGELLKEFEQLLPQKDVLKVDKWIEKLNQLEVQAEIISSFDFDGLNHQMTESYVNEVIDWFGRPRQQIRQLLDEIQHFAPHIKELPQKELTIRDLLDLPNGSKWQQKIEKMVHVCDRMVESMDFGILYLRDRDLFSIGYNTDRASLDKGTYDLLASEARLASFIAIAKGDVPPKHWFKLSRRLTSIDRNEILLSWGGRCLNI